MSTVTPKQALADLWRAAGQPAAALDAAALNGAEPVLPSSFAVGTPRDHARVGAGGE
jgi:hypothetical protein